MVPWNLALGGFAYNWQSKWVGIIAIKTEKNKHQTRNCSLQTVNYKWSWENIQCVKDFPALLLALYKRGRAILFWFRFRWHSFRRNLAVVVFVDKRKSKIALHVFPHFVLRHFVKDAWLSAWVIHAEHIRAMWLAVVLSPLRSVVLKITRDELPME